LVSLRTKVWRFPKGDIPMKLRIGCVVVGFLLLVLSLAAQTASSGSTSSQVPPLIPFSSVASDEGGSSLSGVVNITFSLYNSQQGGQPLWIETQNNVQLDATGHYSVQLGITKPNGVPTTLFTSGEARWLGVRIAEQAEQPRVLLLSVPYALKAGDAATIGGLPPSAFVLAAPPSGTASGSGVDPTAAQGAPPPSGDITGTGTVNYLPLWDSTSDIISSVLFQKGTGSSAKIGINTATPATTLDVKGGGTIRGTLSLPATGAATATAGKNSQPLNLAASAFNSTSSTAVNQTFQWQSEPVGNNTSTPSGTLNLLFGEGATKPSETGLNIASNGQITFATGQTFPGTGTGDGTVTSVGSGAGLTGGPITGSGTLSIDTTKVPLLAAANTFTANQTVNGSVTATSFSGNGSSVTGVNASQLGGEASSAFAQLAVANIFTANQTVTGEITAGTGSNSSAGVLGESSATSGQTFGVGGFTSSPAGYGVEGLDVASSGGTAGYFQVNTGSATILQGVNNGAVEFNVDAAGDVSGNTFQIGGRFFATQSLTSDNLSVGDAAGTGGSSSTAIGIGALGNNVGYSNTANGFEALLINNNGFQNTAMGYFALGAATTGSDNTAIGYLAGSTSVNTNLTGSDNTALGANTFFGTTTLNNATAVGANAEVSESNALVLGSINGVNNATASTNVGIGTTAPGHLLDVAGAVAFDSTGLNNGNGIDLTFGIDAGEGVSSSRTAGPNQYGLDLYTDYNRRISIEQHGNVGIGTATPSNLLTLVQGGGAALADGWNTYSSRRWKTHIQPLQNALGKVEQLRGVSYDLKGSGKHEIGVIAEEVGAVVPEVVTYEDNGKDARSVDYSRLTALLIEATKQQQRQFRQQGAELAKALLQIKQQQNLLRAQSAAMRSLKAEVNQTRESLRKVKAQVSAAQPTLVAAK
jgi:hypothetical protein